MTHSQETHNTIKGDNPDKAEVLHTAAHNFHTTAALVDRLHVGSGQPGTELIARLQNLLRTTVEMQENISESWLHLRNTDDIL